MQPANTWEAGYYNVSDKFQYSPLTRINHHSKKLRYIIRHRKFFSFNCIEVQFYILMPNIEISSLFFSFTCNVAWFYILMPQINHSAYVYHARRILSIHKRKLPWAYCFNLALWLIIFASERNTVHCIKYCLQPSSFKVLIV